MSTCIVCHRACTKDTVGTVTETEITLESKLAGLDACVLPDYVDICQSPIFCVQEISVFNMVASLCIKSPQSLFKISWCVCNRKLLLREGRKCICSKQFFFLVVDQNRTENSHCFWSDRWIL